MAKTRPLGVTILAVLALLGAINAAIITLQMLHILPVMIGSISFYTFSFISAILWGILVFIWLGIFGALMQVHPQGWMFMMLLSTFNLIYALLMVVGSSSWEAMAPMIIVSGLVLVYCLLPGTKQAFGIPE